VREVRNAQRERRAERSTNTDVSRVDRAAEHRQQTTRESKAGGGCEVMWVKWEKGRRKREGGWSEEEVERRGDSVRSGGGWKREADSGPQADSRQDTSTRNNIHLVALKVGGCGLGF